MVFLPSTVSTVGNVNLMYPETSIEVIYSVFEMGGYVIYDAYLSNSKQRVFALAKGSDILALSDEKSYDKLLDLYVD